MKKFLKRNIKKILFLVVTAIICISASVYEHLNIQQAMYHTMITKV